MRFPGGGVGGLGVGSDRIVDAGNSDLLFGFSISSIRLPLAYEVPLLRKKQYNSSPKEHEGLGCEGCEDPVEFLHIPFWALFVGVLLFG